MHDPSRPRDEPWPPLPLAEWEESFATLHRWMQIVGKIRLTLSPWINHAWQATLYPTARGLTTSAIPYGERTFEIHFDFIDHKLRIESSDGEIAAFPLEPQTVARFHRRIFEALDQLGLTLSIHGSPNEVADPIPFAEDETHAAYDPVYVERFWRILLQVQRVFTAFRARFIGKSSPVHLFWGAADLATTRFSGRMAPMHPGGVPGLPDPVTREAYSHEVSSCGFWPGGGAISYPAFYAYAYPEPTGYAEAKVGPAGAFYSPDFREFILAYDRVRDAASPEAALMEFLESTYGAAADLAGWDRAALEGDRDPR